MNLDNLSVIQKLDHQNMLAEIKNLPDQFARAWALGQSLPLPEFSGITRVVISGMAYYLAVAYSIDPTAIEALASLKTALAAQK